MFWKWNLTAGSQERVHSPTDWRTQELPWEWRTPLAFFISPGLEWTLEQFLNLSTIEILVLVIFCSANCPVLCGMHASIPASTHCWYHLPTLAGILIIKNVSRNYQMSIAGRSSRAKSWPVENHYLSEKFFRCKPQNFLIYHPRREFLPFLFASIAWDRGSYKKSEFILWCHWIQSSLLSSFTLLLLLCTAWGSLSSTQYSRAP